MLGAQLALEAAHKPFSVGALLITYAPIGCPFERACGGKHSRAVIAGVDSQGHARRRLAFKRHAGHVKPDQELFAHAPA